MDDARKLEILRLAYAKVCKWIRQNPPGNIDDYNDRQLAALTGAAEDPEGQRWVNCFIMEALDELAFIMTDKGVKDNGNL